MKSSAWRSTTARDELQSGAFSPIASPDPNPGDTHSSNSQSPPHRRTGAQACGCANMDCQRRATVTIRRTQCFCLYTEVSPPPSRPPPTARSSVGHWIGAPGPTVAEMVFNTAITGYQEILTDPSYCQQIVTFTYPHIGNCGVNEEDVESDEIHAARLVINNLPTRAVIFRATATLAQSLVRGQPVAIANVDTRQLTRLLRSRGAQNGAIIGLAAGQQVTPARIDEAITLAR